MRRVTTNYWQQYLCVSECTRTNFRFVTTNSVQPIQNGRFWRQISQTVWGPFYSKTAILTDLAIIFCASSTSASLPHHHRFSLCPATIYHLLSQNSNRQTLLFHQPLPSARFQFTLPKNHAIFFLPINSLTVRVVHSRVIGFGFNIFLSCTTSSFNLARPSTIVTAFLRTMQRRIHIFIFIPIFCNDS